MTELPLAYPEDYKVDKPLYDAVYQWLGSHEHVALPPFIYETIAEHMEPNGKSYCFNPDSAISALEEIARLNGIENENPLPREGFELYFKTLLSGMFKAYQAGATECPNIVSACDAPGISSTEFVNKENKENVCLGFSNLDVLAEKLQDLEECAAAAEYLPSENYRKQQLLKNIETKGFGLQSQAHFLVTHPDIPADKNAYARAAREFTKELMSSSQDIAISVN